MSTLSQKPFTISIVSKAENVFTDIEKQQTITDQQISDLLDYQNDTLNIHPYITTEEREKLKTFLFGIVKQQIPWKYELLEGSDLFCYLLHWCQIQK